MDKKRDQKRLPIIIWLIFFILSVVAGLIYLLGYDPILTADLADEIAYAKFLHSNNTYWFHDNWITTKAFFPFGRQFFLTVFAGLFTEWKMLTCVSQLICYALYAFIGSALLPLLKSRKKNVLLITATALLLSGIVLLLTSHFTLLVCGAFLFLGLDLFLFLSGLQKKIWLKVLAAIAAVLPMLLLILSTNSQAALHNVPTPWSTLLQMKYDRDDADVLRPVQDVADFLVRNGISSVYSTSRIRNTAAVYTKDALSVLQVEDIFSPDHFITKDCIPYPETVTSTGGITVLLPTSDLENYKNTPAFILGDTIYSDSCYTAYSFPKTDLLTNAAYASDLLFLMAHDYDTVLYSMWDCSTYETYSLDHYTGWYSYFTAASDPQLRYFDEYNDYIFAENLRNYFCCVDPELLWVLAGESPEDYRRFIEKNFLSLVQNDSTVSFNFLFPGYHLSHFQNYDADALQKLTDAYRIFTEVLQDERNAAFHFIGNLEWLNDNPALFEANSDITLQKQYANRVLTQVLAKQYQQTPEEIAASLSELCAQITSYQTRVPRDASLQEECLVIYGDSIFGLYPDDTGIQAIIERNTGIKIVFEAQGGATASERTDGSDNYLLHRFHIPDLKSKLVATGTASTNPIFFIEYGLNDFFLGYPACNPNDLYDKGSYEGAVRTVVEAILHEWPASRIILFSPGYYGADAEMENVPYLEGGDLFYRYQAAAKRIVADYDLELVDLTQIGITRENLSKHTDDFVHYNESGRYLIANYLIDYLQQ